MTNTPPNTAQTRTRFALVADSICGLMVLLAAAGLFYSWNKSDLLAYRGVLVGYASVSAVCLVVYGSSFFFRRAWRANLAMVTVSTVMALYAVEGFQWLRNANIDQFHGGAAKAAGEDFDQRTKAAVVEALRAEGVEAKLDIPVIDFHESMATHGDPLSLYPFRVNGHFNADGYALLAKQIARRLDRDCIGRVE